MPKKASQAMAERKIKNPNYIMPNEDIINEVQKEAERIVQGSKKGIQKATQETAEEVLEDGVQQAVKHHHLGKVGVGAATLIGMGMMVHNMSARRGQQSNQELYGQKRSYM